MKKLLLPILLVGLVLTLTSCDNNDSGFETDDVIGIYQGRIAGFSTTDLVTISSGGTSDIRIDAAWTGGSITRVNANIDGDEITFVSSDFSDSDGFVGGGRIISNDVIEFNYFFVNGPSFVMVADRSAIVAGD